MPGSRQPTTVALLTTVLATAWLLWSGIYAPLLLGLGALSVGLVLWLSMRLRLVRPDAYSLPLGLRLPRYLLWLAGQVAMSAARVALIVLTPRAVVRPTLVRLHVEPRTPVGRATLGNSITLTPGTITVEARHGHLLVHCLTREDAVALIEGPMNRRVAALTEHRRGRRSRGGYAATD